MSRIRKRKKIAKEIQAELVDLKIDPMIYFTTELETEKDTERLNVLRVMAQHYINFVNSKNSEILAEDTTKVEEE